MKKYLVTGRGSKSQKKWEVFYYLSDARQFASKCNWRDVQVFEGEAIGSEEPEPKREDIDERGIKAASDYLERLGYEVLERGWSCPAGSIDLIADDDGTIVFIDVRTRTDFENGFPKELVDEEMRDRFERIAMWWLHENDYVGVPLRFDVVTVMACAEDRAMVRHYVNAINEGF